MVAPLRCRTISSAAVLRPLKSRVQCSFGPRKRGIHRQSYGFVVLSSSIRICPDFISCPSRTCNRLMMPDTRGRTRQISAARQKPVALMVSTKSPRCTMAVCTGTGEDVIFSDAMFLCAGNFFPWHVIKNPRIKTPPNHAFFIPPPAFVPCVSHPSL